MRVVDTPDTASVAGAAPDGPGLGHDDARRRRAHGQARRHSARVRALRRLIPLAAGAAVLGLAGLVFLGPLSGVPGVRVGPVSVSGTKVTMENPRLSGFRKGDRGYEVTAAAALQDVRRPAIVELQGMRGHLAVDEKGGRAHVEAKGGVFDSTRESLTLAQDIRLWTDRGEEVRLKSATVDFKAGTLRSADPVAVTVPSGRIVADTLDVADNGRVVSFVGGVHAEFHGPEDAPGRIRTSSAEAPEAAR